MKTRLILAENVKALLDRDYPARKYKNKSARQQAASRAIGVSWSTIQRLLDPHVGKHMDVVADVAAGFTVTISALLRPNVVETKTAPDIRESEELQRRHG